MLDRNIPPSQKGEIKAKAQKAIEDSNTQADEMLRGAFCRVASTADGVIVLQWIAKECGWGNHYLAADPRTGEINEKATLYQAFRVNLWWKARKFLSYNLRREVEDNE